MFIFHFYLYLFLWKKPLGFKHQEKYIVHS